MFALVLKIALGVFAFVVALLGVTDLKTVRPQDPETPKSWAKRITRIGVLKIFCAVAALVLLGLNEVLSYQVAVAASKQAEIDSQKLQSKIDQAGNNLIANILQLRSLARTNDYLVATLDSSLIRDGAGIDRRLAGNLAFSGT
jgi:hypothetical protein